MLLGRDPERARLERVLAEARAGSSGALVLCGQPGIGKTALLREAVERAGAMTVISIRAVEAEAELPFAGLAELLRPVLGHIDELPAPQAAALRAALAIGPGGGDRLAVATATLGILAAAAVEAPLLAVVDDAHWLDPASAETLAFAARRLGAEGVALLLAMRDSEQSAFDPSGLDQLEVGRLDPDQSATLLAAAGHVVDASVAERLVDALGGNPLALIEVPALLDDAQLAGSEPLDEPLPLAPAIERAFVRRVGELPEDVGRMLLLAAVSGPDELGAMLAAAGELGIEREALEQAEASGLVSIGDGRLDWQHPLLRAAVYHGASPALRRSAHHALAAALEGPAASTLRRAHHLAAAAVGPSEAVAAALEEAALAARIRGGLAEAGGLFERAARLSPGAERGARRLLEAARDLQAAGRLERAVELLDEALPLCEEPSLRAEAQHLRGWIEVWRGAPLRAHELLSREAEHVAGIAPAKAAAMLVDAALTCGMRGDVPRALATARRAYELAPPGTVEHRLADAGVADALVMSGRAPAARESLARSHALLRELPLQLGVRLTQIAGHASAWVEDYAEAERALDNTIEAARAAGALGLLPFPLACRSELDFRLGRWRRAYAEASESLRIAEETGQANESCFSLVCLARVEAAQGRVDDCREHVERALTRSERLDVGCIPIYCGSVLGLLELGLGRPADAVIQLELVARLAKGQGLGDPSVVQWAPDLVMSYALAGREQDAHAALVGFERQARATERSWALAAAARCRGFMADDDSFEREFGLALDWHAQTPTPFERALTELRFGERLRRARRLMDARARFRSALFEFERLHADPWSDRARSELGACGERPPSPPVGLAELTPQELQVALLVADGATNSEAAMSLFLSPKTVEYHLGRVYRKLGIRSRAQLARLVARGGGDGDGASAG